MPRSIEQLIDYCALNGIGGPISCEGCTVDEIQALEQANGVSLPRSYREFLLNMGHGACNLFAHDHAIVNYNEAMTLVNELPERIAGERRYRNGDFEFDMQLPGDSLLIGSRLGDWHWYIQCSETDDPPVWTFGITGQHGAQVQNESFVEWLFGWATEARMALDQSQN